MITELVIRSFRGIPDERRFPLKQITLLSGRNGLGKTTFFDALDWCLFGDTSRLGDDPGSLANLYSPSSSSSVDVILSSGTSSITLTRRLHNSASILFVDDRETSERDFLDRFVTDREVFPPHSRGTPSRVRDLLYLEQARIRSLVSAETEEARTELFQALLGVPHAATVRASIRKVNDTLDGQLRRLRNRLSSLQADLAQPETAAASDLALQLDALTSDIRTRARELLGDKFSRSLTPRELNSIARSTLQALQTRNRLLTDAASVADALRNQLQQTAAALQSRKDTLRLADEVCSATRNQHSEAQLRRKAAELELTQARSRRDATSSSLDSARLRARQREEMLALEAQVASQRSLAREAQTRRDSLASKVTTTRPQLLHLERLSADLKRRTLQSSARQEQRRRRTDLDTRRRALAQQAAGYDQGIQQQLSFIPNLQEQLDVAFSALESASRSHSTALAPLQASDRVASLSGELRRLAAQLGLTDCPTCGTAFPNPQDLLSHIDGVIQDHGALTQRAAALRRRRDDLEQEHRQVQSQLATAQAHLSELQRDRDGVARDLADLDRELASISPEDNSVDDTPVAELRQQLVEAEENSATLRASLQLLESQHTAAVQRSTQATVDLSRAEQRLLAVTREHTGRQPQPTEDPDVLEEQMHASSKEVEHRERLLRDAIQAEQQALDKHTDASAKSDLARSALDTSEERIRTDSAKLVEVIQSATGAGGTRATIDTSRAELDRTENAIRRLIEDIDALLSLDMRREELDRLQSIRILKDNTAREVNELERAQARFAVVASGIIERANSEEIDALNHQRQAIQECLRTLLPHKHLDEIDIDPASGAILLSDYLLQRRRHTVEAHRYLSTGQANALALSMFVGIALRQRITSFDFMLMDEPVQNLDDIHFLAFLSLVKRVALDRQVVFSTADSNIAEIFRRQMKSTWQRHPDDYTEYEWLDFSPIEGPHVLQRT